MADLNQIKELLQTEEYKVCDQMFDFAVKLSLKYGLPIGSGNTRVVWNTKKGHVIKVPRNSDGSFDNSDEARYSRNHKNKNKNIQKSDENLALTRSFIVNDFVIIISEYIEHLSFNDIKSHFNFIPDWVYSIDCMQVGLDKNGFLKAYDFA